MSYTEEYNIKLQAVTINLISYCQKCITDNWTDDYDMWNNFEADMEIWNGYESIFKKEFDKYITPDIQHILWIASKNTTFSINAFIKITRRCRLIDVLEFVKAFIVEQMDDFDNWCDDISMKMYEESSDYQKECGNGEKRDLK
jgi:hypothetical protein